MLEQCVGAMHCAATVESSGRLELRGGVLGMLVRRAARSHLSADVNRRYLCVWVPVAGSYTPVPEGSFLAAFCINIICKYF